jgi:hypothetical protein
MHKGEVVELHPTQIVVGYKEVELKEARLEGMTEKELDLYLQEHPFPVVTGPRNRKFMIDHHHLGLALVRRKHKHCYYNAVHEFHTIPPDKFFRVMSVMELLYLGGPDGKLMSVTQIPKRVEDLVDDPYRSLAGVCRDAGGFTKVHTPYSEFQWASFFRDRIIIDKQDWEGTVKHAVQLAGTIEAKFLPGFIGLV